MSLSDRQKYVGKILQRIFGTNFRNWWWIKKIINHAPQGIIGFSREKKWKSVRLEPILSHFPHLNSRLSGIILMSVLILNARNLLVYLFYNRKIEYCFPFLHKNHETVEDKSFEMNVCADFRRKWTKKSHVRKPIGWNSNPIVFTEKKKISLDLFSFR